MSYLDKVTVGSTTYDIQDSKAQADVADLKSAVDVCDDIMSLADTVQINFSLADGTGGIKYSDGTVLASTFIHTDYVNVSMFSEITYKQTKHTGSTPSLGMAFYSDKSESSFISGVRGKASQPEVGYTENTTAVPHGAKYARFSVFSSTETYGAFSLSGKSLLHGIEDAIYDVVDLSSAFVSGAYIDTSGGQGDTVNITPEPNNGFEYLIIPCKKGDVYTVTLKGGTYPYAWTLTDKTYEILSKSSTITVTDKQFVAGADGYLIANNVTSFTKSIKRQRLVSVDQDVRLTALENTVDDIEGQLDDVTNVTNPHLLRWQMGEFSGNGPIGYSYGMLPTTRMFTTVKVKAGSTVAKDSSGTRKNLAVAYKLNESDESWTYSSNVSSYTFSADCIAMIGVRYSGVSPLPNLINQAILDEFDFDLKVVDYKSQYDKTGLDGYGKPCPEIYYEGQHTDETGWTNSFSDISAIYAAFDALVTASDGYLTKKRDYGVVYTGNAGNSSYSSDSEWHIYEYSTVLNYRTIQTPPKVAIVCCLHGNEKMSAYAMHYLMYDLINNSIKNPVLSYLRNNCILTFIPVANPYGFMKSTPSRLNENGVNLNRNFPTYNWDEWEDTRTDGNGSGSGDLNYKGESAASETETQAVMKFIRNNYDAVIAIDLHTNGSDTVARDQIAFYMPTQPEGSTDQDYDILHSYLAIGGTQNNRLKSWLNEKYGAGLSNAQNAGGANFLGYFPAAPQWIREAAGLPGVCYEVMAGSSTGFIGQNLTQYGAATIKAAAEELGNMICALVEHCRTNK